MTTNTSSGPSTIFDADEYEREQGNLSDGGDWESVTTQSDMPEAHPRYVPPHKRPVRLEMGDFTQVQVGEKPDEQGILNRAFQKLMIYVHFALTKVMIEKLSKRFPGCFFHSDSHGNHDHPIAHVVTQVGTRFLQRMIPAGVNVLDVYGSPRACDAFNASQSRARNPKVMYSLVANACPSDFIREVNKWGPAFDPVGARYAKGHIRRQPLEFLDTFDVFTMIHTLYYVTANDLCTLLHSFEEGRDASRPSRKKALALIHTHHGKHGFLNEREQEYWVNGGIVKQRNVATNTTYCHPDITPFWFRENKVHYLPSGRGFSWECHLVCEDTWIIEIVGCDRKEIDDDFANDWDKLFDLAGEAEAQVYPTHRSPLEKPVTILPSRDGKFVELDVCSIELFSHLRRRAAGKDRSGKAGRQLIDDLFATAKNLVHPSALFPDAKPIECPDGKIADHVISAFVTDVERETSVFAAVDQLQSIVYGHSHKLTGKRGPPSINSVNLVDALRAGTKVGLRVAKTVRSKDAVVTALDYADQFLDDGLGH